jgi:hypothetical protein
LSDRPDNAFEQTGRWAIRPFSVASWFVVANAAVWISAALYHPFDTSYCADGCDFWRFGFILRAAYSLFGHWGPRGVFLGFGIGLLAILPQLRLRKQK